MTLKLMGKKKGMTRLFDEKGNAISCTVIEAQPNVVIQVKFSESDGYRAIQLGAFRVAPSRLKNVTKPLKGHFAKAKTEPYAELHECRINEKEEYTVGQEVTLGYFADVKHVDVTGVSKGKGYQGVMKRHNFSGGPGAHGSGFHRHAGSTGMRSTPGRTLPGLKMPGHMGNKKVTVEGLAVVKIDEEKGIILVKGAVPGARGCPVFVRKSVKKAPKK